MIRTLAGSAAILLLALALLAPGTSPVYVSYVTSDSMTPAIDTSDGYVLVPAGTVRAGDIITFYSAERGTYVTHRAVGVTDDGLVTRGDANPSTDQAAGYPLVQRSDVIGRVAIVGETPLLVPHLGTALALFRTHWYLAIALTVGVALSGAVGASRPRGRDTVLQSREVVLAAAVVAVLVGATLVSLAAVHQTELYRVTAVETSDQSALTVGAARTETFTLRLTKSPVTYHVTDTSGMRVVDTTAVKDGPSDVSAASAGSLDRLRQRLLTSSTRTVTATIPPPETTGLHRTTLAVYPYPATLPRALVTALHAVHPLAAAIATVSVVVAPVYVFHWALFDTGTPLRSGRNRTLRRLRSRR